MWLLPLRKPDIIKVTFTPKQNNILKCVSFIGSDTCKFLTVKPIDAIPS